MRYLVLIMLLVGCNKENEPKPRAKRVPSILCISDCVSSFTHAKEEISGEVVKDFRQLCEDKFKVLKCCESRYTNNYYRSCDE